MKLSNFLLPRDAHIDRNMSDLVQGEHPKMK